jgi:hypothetical protein
LEEQLKGVTTRVEQEAKILGMSSFARCRWRGKTSSHYMRLSSHVEGLRNPALSGGHPN